MRKREGKTNTEKIKVSRKGREEKGGRRDGVGGEKEKGKR